ncbi:TIGR02301 family protein [Rhizobium sp. KVB221]|uniref:TIGR02301 family protein n=1 Tax=Rhizobium setariae TaxID=2801340 RepID=A0A936YMW4_9HYPH|nr:TIGR02301 family protein [Rhizobium setariae]MBL0371171.1 TIGR02301 family protein [Rhizobium setariae]
MFLRGLLLSLTVSALFLQTTAETGAAEKKKAEEKPAAPAPVEEKPAPYDDRLLRMAEILGSVHYLRNLCNGRETEWRQLMTDLLAEETRNEPKRAAALTAGFNRGYRSFAATYTKCTPQAVAAEGKYRAEGATLASEIAARFGN